MVRPPQSAPKAPQNIAQNTEMTKKEKKGSSLDVFNFVFSILSVLCLFFILLSFVYADVYTYERSYGISGNYLRSYFDAHNGLGVIAFLFLALGSLAFGIVSFVMSIVKKVEREKLFASITRLLIGILFVIISIMIAA